MGVGVGGGGGVGVAEGPGVGVGEGPGPGRVGRLHDGSASAASKAAANTGRARLFAEQRKQRENDGGNAQQGHQAGRHERGPL